MALDGDTGLVDWSFSPPEGGELNPLLWIGPRRVALQVRKPNAILVLETASGRRLAEYPQTDEDGAWMRDPLPIDDDHVALVTDRRTVALFDLGRGAYAWTFRESPTLPTLQPPRLLGDAERLLVIQDGNELIRLDVATGAKRWSRPLGVEILSERPEAMALDADRVYWASGRTLNAAALGGRGARLEEAPDRPRGGLVDRPDRTLRRGLPRPFGVVAGGRRRASPWSSAVATRGTSSSDCSSRRASPRSPSGSRTGASWSPPGGTSGRYGDRRAMDGARAFPLVWT